MHTHMAMQTAMHTEKKIRFNVKKMISTSQWHVEHLLACRNTQQSAIPPKNVHQLRTKLFLTEKLLIYFAFEKQQL